jgi:ubiquinone/menaquinone biosynthesis C-methylase UbiE
MVKQSRALANVTGLDGDPEVLSIAQSKAAQANVNIKWDQGLASKLPYPDSSFDLVVSSLVIHHLTGPDKLRAFQEVRRVLRPAGWFHIVDFGRPFSLITRVQARIMFNLEEAADNFTGQIEPMLQQAGFSSARETEKINTIFGPVWFYEAQKPKGLISG